MFEKIQFLLEKSHRAEKPKKETLLFFPAENVLECETLWPNSYLLKKVTLSRTKTVGFLVGATLGETRLL